MISELILVWVAGVRVAPFCAAFPLQVSPVGPMRGGWSVVRAVSVGARRR